MRRKRAGIKMDPHVWVRAFGLGKAVDAVALRGAGRQNHASDAQAVPKAERPARQALAG